MNIGIVAPSPVPFCIGGAEKLWSGLFGYINQQTTHKAELIKLPSREHSFWDLIDTYHNFSKLDLSQFDVLISGKYPGWMARHTHHVCYMLHRLRGLYDTYDFTSLPTECDTSNPNVKALVDFMHLHQGVPARLEEFFDRVNRLRTADGASDTFLFPGPLIRQVVHFLDSAGLATSGIRKYAAISRNVASRREYFPAGSNVEVLYPPSDLRDFADTGAEYFFTVGRLDRAKRIGLLVEAMRRTRGTTVLKIAGKGPEEAAIRRLADNDPRIEFLGFVNDQDLVGLYANSLAVPYVPYDEDYGLVTVEAMASGKPVLTTTDAGGPTEFVRDGETGYVVEPYPQALAECLDYMSEHRQEVLAMKQACRSTVRPIKWEKVCRGLFQSRAASPLRPTSTGTRRQITVTTTFPVYPPYSGGQSRIFHLYRQLVSDFDIEIISFTDYGKPEFDELIANGIRETRIPKSREHARAEWRLTGKLKGVAASDVIMPKLYGLTPRYLEVLKRSAAGSDLLVASHPYLLPALRAVRTDQELIYEAQDVEAILKKSVLPRNRLGKYFLRLTKFLEQQCCELSALVLTCSEQDRATLHQLYKADPQKVVTIPNGVDLDSVRYRPPSLRRRLKLQYQGRACPFTTLFMASWHGPNIDAALCLLHIARELPHIRFLLLGSIGEYLRQFGFTLPGNVESFGVVDDETKDEVLSWVDLAINPMESGSGTNLKMLDYMAAGVPVLTTAFGARGLQIEDGCHARVARLPDFPGIIEEMRNQHVDTVTSMVERAHSYAADHFSWAAIAQRLLAALHDVDRPRKHALAVVGSI
jgi:glycosyltransferase involved in cell wall biosynthesis